MLLVLSQIVSSVRLNNILHSSGFQLSSKSNLKLYFVGMFYNFFIPGGVGGDAYKVFKLNKTFDWKTSTLTKIILVDRLIGFIAIGTLIVLLFACFNLLSFWFRLLAGLLTISSYFIGKNIIKSLFKSIDSAFFKSYYLSLIVQFLQLLSVLSLAYGTTSGSLNWIPYGIVFLVSSILSVVSFSGFGAREFTFAYAASFFAINPDQGIAIALAFNLITALVSLIGIIFVLNLQNSKLKLQNEVV
ncbi:lysylphosphatidylglycerol synthase transmembrane domain-containing protein [Flavobacteriaceae bacterium MHTCC 0001]